MKARHYILVALAMAWMALIFYNSSLPGDESSSLSEMVIAMMVRFTDLFAKSRFIIGLQDILKSGWFHIFIRKSAHFMEFGILGLLYFGSLGGSRRLESSALARFGVASGTGILYAVSDEVHQLFVPGRTCSVVDVLIDAAGVLIFTGIAVLVYIKRRKQHA